MGCWVTLTQQKCNLLPYEEERQGPLNPLLHLIVPEIKPAMIIKLWKDIFQSWRNNTAFPCQHNNCTVDPAIPFKINNGYNDYNDKGTCTGLFFSSSRHSRWPSFALGRLRCRKAKALQESHTMTQHGTLACITELI